MRHPRWSPCASNVLREDRYASSGWGKALACAFWRFSILLAVCRARVSVDVHRHNPEKPLAMEFVQDDGLLCQEKQISFQPILATSSFQALYARPLALQPVFPFGDFVIDIVYQLAADSNFVHALKQQTLEDQSFPPVVFPLEPFAKRLDVALEEFDCGQIPH
jgi:hypothetical protein